jgi:hypothetical protein
MTKFAIISDVQILEGLVASICFPVIVYLMKLRQTKSKQYIEFFVIAWFFTWVIRKCAVNTFTQYKTYYNEPIKTFYIDLPISF